MGGNSPCNSGDAGSISGREAKTSHATEQVSLRATTTEPMPQGTVPVVGATKTPCSQNFFKSE